jgi:CelD/BcsL family acetyltransferase involved in cellulose biosynthesis
LTTEVRAENFDSIWSRWEQILPKCVTDTVFVTPWWHKTWWDNFGGSRELRILSVSDGDDLLGIAPLMSDGDRLTFLGDKDLSDYFDFVVPQDRVDQFFPTLWEHLSATEWATLDLPSLPSGSPTLEQLPSLAKNAGLSVTIEEEETTPTAELPATWDEFLLSLRKKDRHELRRKIRRLDRENTHRQYVADDGEVLNGSMQDFFRLLRASREDKNEFLTPERETFFLDIARESVSRGQFRLSFLEVDGENVAACICFDYGDNYLLYNSGYDPSYSRLSVGLINKALSLQSAIEEGRKTFNFLKGNERYKYNLGGQDELVYHLTITR